MAMWSESSSCLCLPSFGHYLGNVVLTPHLLTFSSDLLLCQAASLLSCLSKQCYKMTDYEEEQAGELETLQCIYTGGELTEVGVNPTCFQIHVEPASGDSEESSVSVDIQFTYTPKYPDEAPEVEIINQSGLNSDQETELDTYLKEQADENLGMVMIFTLVSAAQDKLVELMEAMEEMQKQEKKRQEEELKRQEEAKFHGTPVTKESFLEWRKRFEKEMREAQKPNRSSNVSGSKLTGRQMFEQDASLALSDTRFLTEGTTGTEADMEQKDVEVDESLFQDLEDLELEGQS